MSDSPFVQRMRALDAERLAATSLSEKIRIDHEMAELLAANARGETIQPLEQPFDSKMAQAGDEQ